MRIWMPVRVVPAHGVGGGMERMAEALATGLAVRGHEVRVVTTGHPDGVVEDAPHPLVRVHHVPATTWRRYQRHWWAASCELLECEHREAAYDVILSQSAGALGYVSTARSRLHLPCAVLMYGSARTELRTAWRGARNPRGVYRLVRAGYRVPRHLHAWRAAAPSVDRWLAVSSHVGREVEGELGLPAGSTTIVSPGIDIERFRPDPRRRDPVPVVVVASRLEREKGVDIAVRAIAEVRRHHPAARLVVAGTGHDEGRLRSLAASLGLDGACTFLGLVDHDRLSAVLAAGHVFVLPTRCDEARPVSAIEAMAAGLPVVASRMAGVAEVVTPERTGVLVPPGDHRALTDAVVRLLSDEETRRTMGERARADAVARFGRAAMIDVMESALLELAGGRK